MSNDTKIATVAGRRLSGLERVWLTADRLRPPFVNQVVIEGRGKIKEENLRRAMAAAAAVHPGMCLRLKGALGWSRWVPGPPPVLRVVDGSQWDGMSPKGAPFLEEPLDPFRGPVAELLWVEGDPPRLVFRTHHAVTDGRGAGFFLQDLFCALREEPMEGAVAGPLTDAELARQIPPPAPPSRLARGGSTTKMEPPSAEPPADRPSPTGACHVFSMATTWSRVRIPGHFPRLLPRVVLALSAVARTFSETPLRIGIAVDLRRYAKDLRSSANLTGVLHLDLGNPGIESVENMEARIQESLPYAGRVPLHAEQLRGLPLWLMARIGRNNALKKLRAGRFSVSASLSNLGRQDLRSWSCLGWAAQQAFWIPPGNPGLPLFLTLSGDAAGIDLVGSMPVGLADEGRLERLLADIRADLLVDSLRSMRKRK
ncbi:MAG TPA: hypothetical protein PKW90_03200 [Myxococcota bacterium]|nr:hypothetical protein [Myxococcota bacterium]